VAFTESDRVKIREYLGTSRLFEDYDPRVESAITAIQSTADGGAAPDDSSELRIREYLASLEAIEVQLTSLQNKYLAVTADEVRVDCQRAMAALRSEGRRWVGRLSDILDCTPRHDAFGPGREPGNNSLWTR
tara:strand:- start:2475 stop:2870 length:396 start_codon:yes stop_codon:yes gene_type:complete